MRQGKMSNFWKILEKSEKEQSRNRQIAIFSRRTRAAQVRARIGRYGIKKPGASAPGSVNVSQSYDCGSVRRTRVRRRTVNSASLDTDPVPSHASSFYAPSRNRASPYDCGNCDAPPSSAP